jgi:hypothetical protein
LLLQRVDDRCQNRVDPVKTTPGAAMTQTALRLFDDGRLLAAVDHLVLPDTLGLVGVALGMALGRSA